MWQASCVYGGWQQISPMLVRLFQRKHCPMAQPKIALANAEMSLFLDKYFLALA